MNEFDLIARLTAALPAPPPSVIAGPGDDCAVLDPGLPDHFQLLKTDAVVEGVHFTRETEPERVGHKALGRCLSDVAAMAGTPQHALVTLGLPRDFDPSYLEGVYRGAAQLGARHGVAIVGGETTANPANMFISIALTGLVPKDRLIRRAGARTGDALFVTGELGGSVLGKHLDFEPRLIEARWLAEHFEIHAMMDLSDGLAGDARHLLHASGVGAELLASAIPVSRAARVHARQKLGGHGSLELEFSTRRPALLAALTDGEDFELLFAVASGDAVPLLDAWRQKFGEPKLSCIGRITEEPGLRLRDSEGVRPLGLHGYTHFA